METGDALLKESSNQDPKSKCGLFRLLYEKCCKLTTTFSIPIFIIMTTFIQICCSIYWNTGDRCSVNGCDIFQKNEKISYSSLAFQIDYFKKGELWRPWTYQFLHADYSHLTSNIISQIIYGGMISKETNNSRCALVYTTGVL